MSFQVQVPVYHLSTIVAKCNYVMSNKYKGITDLNLSYYNLPSKLDLAIFHAANKKAHELGNSKLISNCNFSNNSIYQIKDYVENSFYAKNKLISYALSESSNDFFKDVNVIIGKATFDLTKAVFYNENIYNTPEILKYINILQAHYVKITKLNDVEIFIEHFTQKPFNTSDFMYISNFNIEGKLKAQFQSVHSWRVNKNVLVEFKEYKINDPVLANKLLTNNYSNNIFSEETFFHLHNNCNREMYEDYYLNQAKEDLSEYTEVATDFINEVFPMLL